MSKDKYKVLRRQAEEWLAVQDHRMEGLDRTNLSSFWGPPQKWIGIGELALFSSPEVLSHRTGRPAR